MLTCTMMRLSIALATLLLSVTAHAAGLPNERKPLVSASSPTFAVIPFYSPEKIWSLYTPFIEYLRKTTGDAWELQLYSTHDQFVEGVCSGKITVGLAGPAPLSRIRKKCGVKPFLVARGADGTGQYHSVILTSNPAITRLADLKGKKVGLFKGSTAAHMVPVKMLNDAGLQANDFTPIFLSSQDRIIQQLMAGRIDAAGVKETLARKFSGTTIKTIAISDPLPNFAFCAAPSASPATAKRFAAALGRLRPATSRNDAQAVRGWDDEIRHGFITADDTYTASILRFDSVFGRGK